MPEEQPQRLGLVLTGGSLRGICAEAAGLVLLERLGYRFDAIIGASAGAIVGGLYATGRTGEDIVKLLRTATRKDFIDFDRRGAFRAFRNRFKGWHGLLKGDALLGWLRANLPPDSRLETTKPPLRLAVTNVSRGVGQVKTAGPLPEYIRASAAMPFAFRMQEVDGEWYADGGVVNNIPVDDLAEAKLGLTRLFVVTPLKLTTPEPEPDNAFLRKSSTPVTILRRFAKAIERDLRAQNLETGGIPLTLVRPRVPSVDLLKPEKIGPAIDAGLADLERQLKSGELQLAPAAPPREPSFATP